MGYFHPNLPYFIFILRMIATVYYKFFFFGEEYNHRRNWIYILTAFDGCLGWIPILEELQRYLECGIIFTPEFVMGWFVIVVVAVDTYWKLADINREEREQRRLMRLEEPVQAG